jgi:hypothetical protein
VCGLHGLQLLRAASMQRGHPVSAPHPSPSSALRAVAAASRRRPPARCYSIATVTFDCKCCQSIAGVVEARYRIHSIIRGAFTHTVVVHRLMDCWHVNAARTVAINHHLCRSKLAGLMPLYAVSRLWLPIAPSVKGTQHAETVGGEDEDTAIRRLVLGALHGSRKGLLFS